MKGRKRPFIKETVSQVNSPHRKGHFLKLETDFLRKDNCE